MVRLRVARRLDGAMDHGRPINPRRFETSFQAGLGAWLGASFIAVPVMEAIIFGVHLITGE
jgi:hypothetical protein